MTAENPGRKEFEKAVIAKAQAEPVFRQALLKKPKEAIEKAFGMALPGSVEIKIVEETATTHYLVLPPSSSEELSDGELDAVGGGAMYAYLSTRGQKTGKY